MHLRHPGVSDGDSSSCFVINRFLPSSPVFSNALRLPWLAGHVSYREARTRKPLLTLNPPPPGGGCFSARATAGCFPIGVSPSLRKFLARKNRAPFKFRIPTEIFPISSFVENSSGSISIAGRRANRAKILNSYLGLDLVDSMPPRISTGRSCSRSISLDARSCSPRNRRRRISPFFSKPSLLSSLTAKERTDLHTGYATALCSPPRCGGEKTHVCARRAGVWVWGRTRKARPQRFKDSTPGAAGGNLNRNMCEQVLIRRVGRDPEPAFTFDFPPLASASAPLNRQYRPYQ